MHVTAPIVHFGVVHLVVLLFISASDATKDNKDFNQAFLRFTAENQYSRAEVAVVKDRKLILATGYGTGQDGNQITAGTLFPVPSLAESMTGVAILQLIQAGKILLHDKVFGENGILKDIHPWRRSSVDPNLYKITVEHLLHHSSGWDKNVGSLDDPHFAKLYDRIHDEHPNMTTDMDLIFPLTRRILISYVMSQSLRFSPGIKVAYSKATHLLMEEIVETVTGMEYTTFIKKNILGTCGMWNTHLPAKSDNGNSNSDDKNLSAYFTLDPASTDSLQDWRSNIYDIVRLMRCLFTTGQLLNKDNLSKILVKPDPLFSQHHNSWYPGFHIDKGNIWLEAHQHDHGMVIHHNLHHTEHTSHAQELPDSWVVLLHGKNNNNHSHIRNQITDLMTLMDLKTPKENMFLYDLSDLHKHPAWNDHKSHHNPGYIIKYKVDEPHITAYVNAVRDEGFDIAWVTSYTTSQHTVFLLISKHITHPIRSQLDYVFEHGMDHRQLLKRKLQLEELGYNMTMLHSYKSQTHVDPVSFAAIFRPDAFSADTQMKYGTGHLPEPYEKLVQMYYEKQFYPVSQTVVYLDKDEQFSFVFIKEANSELIDFKYYYDLSVTKLAKLNAENMKNNLYLSYLNTYDVSGKFRFSAVFTNATESKGLLKIDQTQDQATEAILHNLKNRFILKFMAPSIGDDLLLKYVTYYEEQ